MAITELLGWTAVAEVQGLLRRVRYDGEAKELTIGNVLAQDAQAILDCLALGAVVGVNPAKLAVGDKKAPVVAEPPRTEAKPADVKPAPAAEPQRPVKEPDLKKAPIEAAPKEDKPPLAQVHNIGDVPEKVAKSGRFIEVLDWVMKSKGLQASQVDEIVAELERLKEQLPAVRRVRDVKDKVISNLAAYAEAGDATS